MIYHKGRLVLQLLEDNYYYFQIHNLFYGLTMVYTNFCLEMRTDRGHCYIEDYALIINGENSFKVINSLMRVILFNFQAKFKVNKGNNRYVK